MKKNKMVMNYSILMSVYYKDNPKWLKESIESMLNQTIKTDDFVIVEDGPIPNELENVLIEYKTKYLNIFKIIKLEKNQGLGLALATGIKNCKNEWIARMDADDISVKQRIEKEFEVVNKYDVDMVGSNIAEFIDDVNNVKAYRKLPETNDEIKKYIKRRNPFGHPSMFIRKSKVIEAGNFRDYHLCEDYDMWIRMIEKNAISYNIQEILVYMRINKDFYKRRGGIKYLKSILKFKKEQLNKGFYSNKDFLVSAIASIITCLMPNNLREFIYKNLLREKG